MTSKILLVSLLVLLKGFQAQGKDAHEGEWLKQVRALFEPINVSVVDNPLNPVTPEKVLLGKTLYHDPRLSKSGLVSCNSCHNLALYGVDGLPTSIGHGWAAGPRNAPSVYNAAFHAAQFWDGRAKDLEEQALGPILNPKEMAMDSPAVVVEKLKSIPGYWELFKKAFPKEKDPIRFENVGKAIAAFERTLLTPSRFDEFLKGNMEALSPLEKQGLKTFMEVGCAACHSRVGIGGFGFFKFGQIQENWKSKLVYNSQLFPNVGLDVGRYQVTRQEGDLFVFKAPSLRNVARTAPYFHDGSVARLEDAVRVMGLAQLGRQLTDDQVKSIVAFLNALTGTIPEDALRLPVLPGASKF